MFSKYQLSKALEKRINYAKNTIKNELELMLSDAAKNSPSDIVEASIRDAIDAGGKRTRPVFLLLCLDLAIATRLDAKKSDTLIAADINDITDNANKCAIAIEFLHWASIVHDDVVDTGKLRRGRQTPNEIFDNKKSVLLGDWIVAQSLKVLPTYMKDVFANATQMLAYGELMQMDMERKIVSREDYIDIIVHKTASLFGACAQMAFLCADSDGAQDAVKSADFYELGKNIGIIFQIIDDKLDYFGDASETGKVQYKDLEEQKVTLPIILLIDAMKEKMREDGDWNDEVGASYNTGIMGMSATVQSYYVLTDMFVSRDNADLGTSEKAEFLKALFNAFNVAKLCDNVILEYVEKCQKFINSCPKCDAGDTMLEFLKEIVRRTK